MMKLCLRYFKTNIFYRVMSKLAQQASSTAENYTINICLVSLSGPETDKTVRVVILKGTISNKDRCSDS